ncbi:MAG: hypothetical protein HYW48_04095 [Deltaproteobacteria bacterium]|nr:hypothetical protein [Deltaproteobacteria bacterium]
MRKEMFVLLFSGAALTVPVSRLLAQGAEAAKPAATEEAMPAKAVKKAPAKKITKKMEKKGATAGAAQEEHKKEDVKGHEGMPMEETAPVEHTEGHK